jgi:hypothetical protein
MLLSMLLKCCVIRDGTDEAAFEGEAACEL